MHDTTSYHPAGPPTDALSTRHLVRAVRGFSCIFWGIPLALLFMAGAVKLEALTSVQVPSYVFGAILIYAGMMFLYHAAPALTRWKRLARQGLLVSLLLIYFSPLVYWWRHQPYAPYYVVNMLALVCCAVWELFVINRIAAAMAHDLGEHVVRVEAVLCGWFALALFVVPGLPLALYAVHASVRLEGNLYEGFTFAFLTVPRWLFALFILPFTLTMTSAWQAKERCLNRLREDANGDELEA